MKPRAKETKFFVKASLKLSWRLVVFMSHLVLLGHDKPNSPKTERKMKLRETTPHIAQGSSGVFHSLQPLRQIKHVSNRNLILLFMILFQIMNKNHDLNETKRNDKRKNFILRKTDKRKIKTNIVLHFNKM